MPRTKNLTPNLAAFLDTLAVSELGDKLLKVSDDGYNVIVGSTPNAPVLFSDYSDHPRRLVEMPKLKIKSTAAGRYQLLARYFQAYRGQFPKAILDFSPATQDWIAIQQIKEQGDLADVIAGRFEQAVSKVKNIWASLPGAGYGQHENGIGKLKLIYVKAGGTIA